jgi:nucleotide-binding universal stress UspA family protein
MSRFDSILLPLDGSPEAAKGGDCALWLAQALGATLHVVHATTHPRAASDALARLHIGQAQHPQVVVHQLRGDAETVVLEEIDTHRIDLVVMTARGRSASAGPAFSRPLGTVAQTVLERSRVPVVLLPARYRESFPWTSMLSAVSGEVAADHALEAAAQLAAALRLEVTVVYSADAVAGTPPLAAYADAPQYEYPQRLQRLAQRGLARCTAEERHCVHDVLLRRGNPASVLLEEVARHGSSLLALGWHGALDAGRARVLKRLLEEAECGLLVVRAAERSRARIKLGNANDEE